MSKMLVPIFLHTLAWFHFYIFAHNLAPLLHLSKKTYTLHLLTREKIKGQCPVSDILPVASLAFDN